MLIILNKYKIIKNTRKIDRKYWKLKKIFQSNFHWIYLQVQSLSNIQKEKYNKKKERERKNILTWITEIYKHN